MRKRAFPPVYSITKYQTRLEMPLMEMRITNLTVIAHLHDNYGVGTYLHRIKVPGVAESEQWPQGVMNCKSIALV